MLQLDGYLMFDGTCAEAMRFYEKTLGGKIEMMMKHAESPMAGKVPSAMDERILHARINFGNRILMASDWMVGQPYPGMHGFALSLFYETVEEAERIFQLLADGGSVTMPIQKTFWADAFGMLSDRYGTPWMVSGPAPKG